MKSFTMQLRKRPRQRNIVCDSNDTKQKRMQHKVAEVSTDPLSFAEPQLEHQGEHVSSDQETSYAQLLSDEIQNQVIGVELDIVSSVDSSHAQNFYQEVVNGTSKSKIRPAKDSVRKKWHTKTSTRTPCRRIRRRELTRKAWSQRITELKAYKDMHGNCMVCLFAINTSLAQGWEKNRRRSICAYYNCPCHFLLCYYCFFLLSFVLFIKL
jgi:hypothetical protein